MEYGSADEYRKAHSSDDGQEKLIYFNRRFSAKEVQEEIDRIAGYLQKNGIGKGDVVGIALPNLPVGIFAFYAANALGGIVNMLHPKLSEETLECELKSTNVKILFLYDAVYPLYRDTLKRLNVKTVLCRVSDYTRGFPRAIISLSERKFEETYVIQLPKQQFKGGIGSSEDIAVYIHSGGTGGEPKTVMLTNGNLNALADTIADTMWVEREPLRESMLMMLPCFHAFGLGIPMHTALSHIKTIVMPVFNAKSAVKLIKKHKITHLSGVPGMYEKMLREKSFEGDYLKGIKFVFCGGDVLNEELRIAFKERLKANGGEAEILQGYGLSEAAAVVTVSRKGKVKAASVGRALNGIGLRIADEKGRALPPKEIGEVWVAGPTVMKGYLDDEKASAETLYEENGTKWCRTGDMGYLDEDGDLYFCDRKKRSLKISAVNVFPAEIERVAGELKEIKSCCAARKTENGKAYIHLYVEADGIEDAEKIGKYLAARLSKYSVPKKITFVESIRRTEMAKIDYRYYETEEI